MATLRWGHVITIAIFITLVTAASKRNRFRKPIVHWPKGTLFWATDFFTRGCKNFLEGCPAPYKVQRICARSYNGDFKNFANYCEMQYENCNSWLNWHVFKREWC